MFLNKGVLSFGIGHRNHIDWIENNFVAVQVQIQVLDMINSEMQSDHVDGLGRRLLNKKLDGEITFMNDCSSNI